MNILFAIVLCAIKLSGVTGTELRARAFFDANNVKVGDPMILTIDFLGEADFHELHPPSLSRVVSRSDWKVDDASAKTDTFRDARRLTYRVRPMREGVLWFPALEFSCAATDGGELTFRANDIPVHAKGGAQVAMDAIGAEEAEEEHADAMLLDDPCALGWSGQVGDDLRFEWKRALAKPSADAFARFDMPAAKYNEAVCAVREGNWARAAGILRRLEWRVGQTEEVERAMVAALALRYDNPSAELPMWRQVLRPLLRRAWLGRLSIVLGGFLAVALVFWLLGRGIRAVACLAVALALVETANAQDIFQQMEERMNQMQQQMFSGAFGFGGREERKPVKVAVSVTTSKPVLQVGEPFEFILSLEYPRTASVGQIRISPSENFGLTFTGQAQNLTDGLSKNPTNLVKRISLPARYDVPFCGKLAFTVGGMVSGRESRRGGMFNLSFSNSFESSSDPIAVEVKPLPSAGQPEGFAGLISEGLRIHETCDLIKVETNDVVTITYRIFPKGYVPANFMPEGAAFEWNRQVGRDGRVTEIEYRRYFVADGRTKTPKLAVSYYDPRTKTYKTATTGETKLEYRTSNEKRTE